MKRAALAALVLLCGCSSTWVTGVATSPDGRIVTVTGAEINYGFGVAPDHPLQWHCVRGPDGRLACRLLRVELPKPE